MRRIFNLFFILLIIFSLNLFPKETKPQVDTKKEPPNPVINSPEYKDGEAAKDKANKEKKPKESFVIINKTVEELKKIGKVETFDFNNDGEPDTFVYYKYEDDDFGSLSQEKKEHFIERKDIDINFDGKIDIKRLYQNGNLVLEFSDYDFDGKFDCITHYKDKEVILKEYDINSDEKPDVFRYYRNGKLVLKEVDRNFDGKTDYWMYFKDDKLIRMGEDTNNDGIPDKWIK